MRLKGVGLSRDIAVGVLKAFLLGGQLAFEDVKLGLDVLNLLAVRRSGLFQFREPVQFLSLFGDLAFQGGYLSGNVQSAAPDGPAAGLQLDLLR